jgi:hypothetical protein
VRPELVASRYVHISANNLFKIGGHSRVCKKIICKIWREVNEQIHIAIGPALFSYDGAEYRDMNNASLPKFGFMGPQTTENVREERHKDVS